MANAALPPLARYTGSDPAIREWSERVCSTLEVWSRSLAAPVGQPWTVSGITAHRTVDPAVLTTLALVVDALGTLVTDLERGAPVRRQ